MGGGVNLLIQWKAFLRMCGVSPLWLSFSAGLSFILQVVSFGAGPIGVTCHLYRFSAVNLGVVVTVESRKLFSTLDSSHILQFSLTSNKADCLLPNFSVFSWLVENPKGEMCG